MNLYLYNDLTRRRELFEPLKAGEVSFYVCGPTVYDYFHIGNARPFIVFDVLRRFMESKGLTVKYIQNFTDIDDKMIQRAQNLGITVPELADRYIAAYYEDADALGVKRATMNPRATHEIPRIIELIEKLVSTGHAYEMEGDVYFDVNTFPEYGKLSGQSIEDLQSGARIDVDERKRSPLDFALWKAEKPGEPAWESPWGRGRPGWHIECSAMAGGHLGETIDIHGGGADLIFPHHENEIAQSEAAHGRTFARFWVHNGYLMIDREKMSKSLGNFFTVRDIRAKHSTPAIRLFMLQAHYRSPINFSEETMEQAANASERLRNGWSEIEFALKNMANGQASCIADKELRAATERAKEHFDECMCDDFNTAGAISAVFDLIRATNTALTGKKDIDCDGIRAAAEFLRMADGVMGILMTNACENDSLSDSDTVEIERLIEERREARKNKNFALSDSIRDTLLERGIQLEDTAQGTRWKRIEQ